MDTYPDYVYVCIRERKREEKNEKKDERMRKESKINTYKN